MRVMASTSLSRPSAVFDPVDRIIVDRHLTALSARPLSSLSYEIRAQVTQGGQTTSLNKALKMIIERTAGGFDLFFNRYRDDKGIVRTHLLPDGRYVASISSEYYQNQDITIDLPPADADASLHRVLLEPGFAYPFASTPRPGVGTPTRLYGALLNSDSRGIEGALVEVPGRSNRYRTNRSGQWVLVFDDSVPSGNVTVVFDLPGQPQFNVPGVEIKQTEARNLNHTALAGRVERDGGAPVVGATITVDGRGGEARAADDGRWTYYFLPNQQQTSVDVTANTPEGVTVTNQQQQVVPRRVSAVPIFRFPRP